MGQAFFHDFLFRHLLRRCRAVLPTAGQRQGDGLHPFFVSAYRVAGEGQGIVFDVIARWRGVCRMAQVVERGKVAVDVEQARLVAGVVQPFYGDADAVVWAAILRFGLNARVKVGFVAEN